MDMTVIDEVNAYQLEAGDTIRFIDEDGNDYGLLTVKSIDDNGQDFLITAEDGTEMPSDYDTPFYLWGYPVQEV